MHVYYNHCIFVHCIQLHYILHLYRRVMTFLQTATVGWNTWSPDNGCTEEQVRGGVYFLEPVITSR